MISDESTTSLRHQDQEHRPRAQIKSTQTKSTDLENQNQEHGTRAQAKSTQTNITDLESQDQEHRTRTYRLRVHRPRAQTDSTDLDSRAQHPRQRPTCTWPQRNEASKTVLTSRLTWRGDFDSGQQTAATVVTHSCMRPDGPWCIERRSDKRPAVMQPRPLCNTTKTSRTRGVRQHWPWSVSAP